MKERFENEKAIFSDHIRSSGLRRTNQRDLIMEVFLSTEEHLTIEALHRLVQKKDNTIGHTTIYRTLKLLIEAGLAREVRFGDNKTYFEHHYDHEHHDHMICTTCGRVIEFLSEAIESLQVKMAENFGFRPTHHSLRMWGVCAECQIGRADTPTSPSGAQPRVRVQLGIGHI